LVWGSPKIYLIGALNPNWVFWTRVISEGIFSLWLGPSDLRGFTERAKGREGWGTILPLI